MKKVDISVVVCVADDLRIFNLLDSIKYDCEVLIVINGGTKEFIKKVKQYKNKSKLNIRIVTIPEKNLSKARNVGMIEAKYDKVVHYDSDCIMVDGALDKYDKALNKYLLVDGKVEFRSDNFQSKIISVQRSMGLPGYALCPSIGINKKIIEQIGYYFDEDIKWIEDSEMNKRAKRKNIEIGIIDELTCIHDNLSFKQDLKSAYRYGCGVKTAARKGLHKKRPTANWNLIIPCFKKKVLSGFYCILWNLIYCIGYYFR